MSVHVCEGVRGKRKRGSFIRKHRKEHGEINISNTGLFTCGGCLTKFRTICCLHIHIDKHQEGGSYTFDHVTKTAFPKYDSACAYTQVENKIFEMIRGNFIEPEKLSKGVQTLDEDVEREHSKDKLIRKSKRIAKRNVNKNNVKSIEESEFDVISVVKNGKRKRDMVNSLVDSPIPLAANKLKSKMQKKKIKTKVENFSTRRKRQKKQDQSKKPVSSDLESSKNKNLTDALNLSQGKEELNAEKDRTFINFDSLESINPKTDEIAASEALLAISKSAEGDSKAGTNSLTSENINVVKTNVNKTLEGKEREKDTVDTCTVGSKTMNMQEEAYVKFLDEHKQESLDNIFLSANSDTNSKKERYECPTCGKYGSRAMISYHKYIHKEQKELSCDVCGKLFQHPSCLKVHLRSHSERMYPCGTCGMKFSRKKYLETHMLKHTGEKPYMCETCGKGYRDSNHLKRHIKHVHDKKRDFECDICQERFFRSDHLKCHRMRHFGPGHRCQFCKKMFKVKIDLERHTKTHTEEKKWFCVICGHGFRYSVPYYNHMSKKHEMSRSEAEVLRKKQIDCNKRAPHQIYIEPSMLEPTSDNTDITEANVRDEMDNSSAELSCKPAVVPTVRKIFIRNSSNHMFPGMANISDSTKCKTGSEVFHFNNKRKEVRASTDITILNPKHDSSMNFGPFDKGYEIVNIGKKSEGKVLQVSSNLTQDTTSLQQDTTSLQQDTTSLQQGLTFALQNAFADEEIDDCRDGGIVGYGECDHLPGDQLVVMAEETVVGDINMMSEITGENTQAVIFFDDNECVDKNMAHTGTMI